MFKSIKSISSVCVVAFLAALGILSRQIEAQNEEGKTDPLAVAFPQWFVAQKLKGNAEAGRTFYESRTYNNDFTCSACHSFNAKDNPDLDGDGQKRAGHPIWGAVHRTNIKNKGSAIAALGANLCVIHFMDGKVPGMTSQELADLNTFLSTGGSAGNSTSTNLDYPAMTRTVPTNLTGGDPERGRRLAMEEYCITCHAVERQKFTIFHGGRKLEGGTVSPSHLQALALRIRNPEFKVNDEMPGYDDQRLPQQDLLDILAWLKAKQ